MNVICLLDQFVSRVDVSIVSAAGLPKSKSRFVFDSIENRRIQFSPSADYSLREWTLQPVQEFSNRRFTITHHK